MAKKETKPAQLRKPRKKAQRPRGISDAALAQLALQEMQKRISSPQFSPFAKGSIPLPPPGVVPKGTEPKLAMDNQISGINGWALAQIQNSALASGIVFLGFPFLSELSQIAEYRAIAEVTATEMTREWIEFKSTATEKDSKTERIKELEEFMRNLKVRDHFRRMVELDYYFGRAHLYLDTGDTDNLDELKTSIGNGRDATSKLKAKKGFLKGLKSVEPIWAYPADYVSNDPLRQDWYNPQSWYVLGKQLHVTRLLTFIGREVPDMLKPSYMFGGLPMSQMARPTVDNWLRARKSTSDLMYRYSVNILKTEMDATTTDGAQNMLKRVQILSQFMNNNGVFMLDKDDEDFVNVSAPLSSIDHLQAQSQEHQSAVSRIPLVKLTGISPSGLNASSEGEIQVWYEQVGAYQQRFIRPHLDTVVAWCQISLWGEVDPEIVYEFKPLKALSAKEKAEMRKIEADTDVAYVQGGILDPVEVRERLSADPESPYDGLVPDDVPEMPGELEDEVDTDMSSLFPNLPRQEGPRREGQRQGNEREGQRQGNEREPREPRERDRGGREPREPREARH